jgi:hypothetical protein
MSRVWEPLAPACAPCREPKGTCFPGPCKIYQARIAAAAQQRATKPVEIDPRVKAVARYLSQNVISGTQDRDPDSEPWGASGRKAWQAWESIARGCLAAADMEGCK